MVEVLFEFVDCNGTGITGTKAVAGYRYRDFFTCDIWNATVEELYAAYKGPDSRGIGVRLLCQIPDDYSC